MKELIEKIVKRLDRLIELSLDKCDGGASENAYKICKDIIHEEAKVYNESVKGDLISRSALLEEIKSLRVTVMGLRAGKGILAEYAKQYKDTLLRVIEEQPTAYNDGWIPCSERLPEVETEVLIYARRKYTGGHFEDVITTAMYEDGTVRENDSCWRWEDIDGEWDEEEDCYIIPEGWWENRHYNQDEVYNNAVDNKVIAWQPLPAPYQPKGEKVTC